MIEVKIYGGGHRIRLKDQLDQLVCPWVPPSLVYKGVEGGRLWRTPRGARQVWGILLGLPSPSRIALLFPIRSRREGKRGRGRRKGGPRPHPLSNSVSAGGRRAPPLGPSPLSPLKPNKAHYFLPVNSCNSPVLRKIPESLRPFPMSEYSLPIY